MVYRYSTISRGFRSDCRRMASIVTPSKVFDGDIPAECHSEQRAEPELNCVGIIQRLHTTIKFDPSRSFPVSLD
jgi:hypothetical protein